MKKIVLLLFLGACSAPIVKQPTLTKQEIETDALFQSISIVDKNTVWISGQSATFVRTQDGGQNWDIFRHKSDTVQFRDIHAFDSSRIILMSAGLGSQSRIFSVMNGVVWREHFVMQDSLGFLDCLDFWDDNNGIAYGDAIDNYPYILLTNNGGRTWNRADTTNMPLAGNGEGGFAASGTCVTTGKDGLAWIATGAGGNARILLTRDYGKSWEGIDSPSGMGESAGHTSIDFIDGQNGFVTGGDLSISEDYTNNCAFTNDGGQTWELTRRPMTKGAFYGGSTAQINDQNMTFVAGPNGLDFTSDFGRNWVQLDTANYWAVNMDTTGIGWAVGKNGRVVRIIIN